jgi:hypothetical protein
MCGNHAGTWIKSPACAVAECSPLSPQRTKSIALEHVGDGLLLAMMMDAGLGPGLNDKYPAP